MDEQSRDNESAVSTKRSQKRIRTIFILVIASFFCLLPWFITQYKTVEEQLIATEAPREIPNAQNWRFSVANQAIIC